VKSYSCYSSYSAFSLVEVLGVTAVLATLAAVSVVSVKDTVQAGQRSSAQREIQTLNSALQNFRSVGGSIPEDATLAQAIQIIMEGTDLAGSNYAPLLNNAPQEEVTIAGVPYSLQYDPENGFSYVNSDGDGFGFGGAEVGAGGLGVGAYPFDITNADQVEEALAALASQDQSSQGYQDYLEALSAAYILGGLSDVQREQIAETLRGEGLVQVGDEWLSRGSGQTIVGSWQTGLMQNGQHQLVNIVGTGKTEGGGVRPFGVDFGVNHDEAGQTLASEQFLNSDLTGAIISNVYVDYQEPFGFKNANLTDALIDVGSSAQGTFESANLTRAAVSGYISGAYAFKQADLNQASITARIGDGMSGGSTSFVGADLSGAKVTSVFATASSRPNLMFFGANLSGTNFIGSTGLQAGYFAGASSLNGTILTGTGVTRAQLEAQGVAPTVLDTIVF